MTTVGGIGPLRSMAVPVAWYFQVSPGSSRWLMFASPTTKPPTITGAGVTPVTLSVTTTLACMNATLPVLVTLYVHVIGSPGCSMGTLAPLGSSALTPLVSLTIVM